MAYKEYYDDLDRVNPNAPSYARQADVRVVGPSAKNGLVVALSCTNAKGESCTISVLPTPDFVKLNYNKVHFIPLRCKLVGKYRDPNGVVLGYVVKFENNSGTYNMLLLSLKMAIYWNMLEPINAKLFFRGDGYVLNCSDSIPEKVISKPTRRN